MRDEFVNVFDYKKESKKHITQMAFDYINGGAVDELTLHRNTSAFTEILLKQNVLVDVSEIDLSTKVLGTSLNQPLVLGAVSLHRLSHPEGEIATAKAAENVNSLMLLSTLSSTPLEDVAEASDSVKWFQLYWFKDKTITEDLVNRAEDADYGAIALTVDAPVLGHREKDAYNQFTLPQDVALENFISMEQMSFPEIDPSSSGLAKYVAEQFDASISWKDLGWLQSITNLPIILKGLQTRKDAERALDHGIDGIIVSNHGGRQLDNSLSSIECLPRVVAGVDKEIDVMLDSGIRRGSDIVKAGALGAKAVLIGRPYIWGLGAAGQEGVEGVYRILIDELRTTMAMMGCTRFDQLDHSVLEEETIPTYE